MTEVRVAIYARSSTGDAAAAVQDQFLVCRAEASRLGSTVVQSYADLDASGYGDPAPDLKRMLDDAAEGQFEAIICVSVNRLSRRTETIKEVTAELNALGVKVIDCELNRVDLAIAHIKELLSSALAADEAAKAKRRAAFRSGQLNPGPRKTR